MSENFLKKVRQEKGFGQSQLAKKAGVSRQMIWGYENGKYEIPKENLDRLAAILAVDPTYIITGRLANSESLGEIDKTRLLDAITLAHDFYKDYKFDREMLSKIAIEIYGFMTDFDKLTREMERGDFDKSLNEKIVSGLAAKCFVDIKKKR